jgi:uncharacterized membrane protein SpoIIM required for sporulation
MALCDLADGSPTKLRPAELKEMIRLYRRISTDLAVVRTVSTNPSLTNYLNDLTARAYASVYQEPRRPILEVLWESIKLAAGTVRRRKAFVFTSITIFLFCVVSMYVLTLSSPAVLAAFKKGEMSGVFDQWKSGIFPEASSSKGAMATAFYASHNPTVSIITGSLGAATFGILSVLFIAQNGAMLGVLGANLAPVHRVDFLLSSIAPHGVPEISGMIMAGAAGLLLGYSLIVPGRKTRSDSLRSVGRDAIVLLVISIALTLIAAPIEGFFSFNPHVPGYVKTTVAVLSLAAWILFWTQCGRNEDEARAASI